MKKKLLMLLAVTAIVSCAKDAPRPDAPDGTRAGTLTLWADAELDLGAVTRAGEGTKVPLKELGYTGTPLQRVLVTALDAELDFNEVYDSPSDYNKENPQLTPGRYMVTVGSNRPLPDYATAAGTKVEAWDAPFYDGARSELIPQVKEGENLPYFEGRSEVTVINGETVGVDVHMYVANTVVRVRFSDNFKKYFASGADFELKTKAGASFKLNYTTEEKCFYVRPQEFTISGTALRQEPSPGIIEAVPVVITPYTEPAPAPTTLYTYTFDVSEVGGKGFTITINDQLLDADEQDTELNDKA